MVWGKCGFLFSKIPNLHSYGLRDNISLRLKLRNGLARLLTPINLIECGHFEWPCRQAQAKTGFKSISFSFIQRQSRSRDSNLVGLRDDVKTGNGGMRIMRGRSSVFIFQCLQ